MFDRIENISAGMFTGATVGSVAVVASPFALPPALSPVRSAESNGPACDARDFGKSDPGTASSGICKPSQKPTAAP